MAIALANMKEGSEEARQKRSVRRHLNKKHKPVDEAVIDEGSEESRQKRARRFAQKKKGEKPIDEATVHVGSHLHMMHHLDAYHNHGIESPHYHIHNIGVHHGAEGGIDTHRYLMIHKRGHNDQHVSQKHPVHIFNLWKEPNHEGMLLTHIVHRQIVE